MAVVACESMDGWVGQGAISFAGIAELQCESVIHLSARLGFELKVHDVGEGFGTQFAAGTEESAWIDVLGVALEWEPAEGGFAAVDREHNNACHVWAGRLEEALEGTAHGTMDVPVFLLMGGRAVVNVVTAAAELARLGADGT